MATKEQLSKLETDLNVTQSWCTSLYTRLEEIRPLATEKLTEEQHAELDALLDEMKENSETTNTLLIGIRDKLKKPGTGG